MCEHILFRVGNAPSWILTLSADMHLSLFILYLGTDVFMHVYQLVLSADEETDTTLPIALRGQKVSFDLCCSDVDIQDGG